MTWFLLAVAVLVLLLLFIPIDLDVFYNGEFCVAVRVLFLKYVFSNKEKKKEKPKSKVKTDGESFSTKFSSLLETIKTVKAIALRSISIKLFKAHITVCSDDPCDTALLFGGINALCYAIHEFFLSFTKIKKSDININADYNGEKTEVLFNIVIRTFLFKFIVSLIKSYADGTIKSKNN